MTHCDHDAALEVFVHHACVLAIRDCLALCSEYSDDDDRPEIIKEPEILDMLRAHYEKVHFESACAKARKDIEDRTRNSSSAGMF